jgi:hypothetical protein
VKIIGGRQFRSPLFEIHGYAEKMVFAALYSDIGVANIRIDGCAV